MRELEGVELMVQHVFDHASRGDADSVIQAVDTFPNSMMHIGKEKALAMENVIAQNKPKVLVELGGFFGYSAIRLAYAARKHNPEAHYYSIELNPVLACVIETLVRYAGLSNIITVLPGNLSKNTVLLKEEIKKRFVRLDIDFLLLDHWKDAYLPDLQLAQKEGFFNKGTVIIADNILYPGAPQYKEYIEKETSLYTSTLQNVGRDAIIISYVN